MATQPFLTPKEGLKQTQILHMAMTIGLIFMFSIMWFVIGIGDPLMEDSVFVKILPVILLGMLGLSLYLYKTRLNQVGEMKDVMEKVEHYRASSIIRWALIEGVALISIVFYFFMKADSLFLLIFIVALIAMIYFRPSQSQFSEDYELTNQEISDLK